MIPFAANHDYGHPDKQKRRLRITREFVGDLTGLKSLDVGSPNPFGKALGFEDNTLETDFNHSIVPPQDEYDVIGCFEVLEHVMNPLDFMCGLWLLLRDGGTCFLSSPTPWFMSYLQTENHFCELKRDRAKILFEYAGFQVVRSKTFRIYDWTFALHGVRPFFRCLLHRTTIWELRK